MVLLAGVDEAGYGPFVGPLCVGLAALWVPAGSGGPAGAGGIDPEPDLWSALRSGVCREPGRGGRPDPRGRVAVADSKALKLSNSIRSASPLAHLERGVLAFFRAAHGRAPESENDLLSTLGATTPAHRCYGCGPGASDWPAAFDLASAGIAANILEGSLSAARARVAALRCRVMGEAEFNALAREGGKGATTAVTFKEHLARSWGLLSEGPPDATLRIGCDRLGGRSSYAPLVEEALPGVRVGVVEQSPESSVYTLRGPGRDGEPRTGVAWFRTEGESASLAVALASMTAKYVRERLMARFNAFWGRAARDRGVEIKPTAGYGLDGRRWIREADAVWTPADRGELVRVL